LRIAGFVALPVAALLACAFARSLASLPGPFSLPGPLAGLTGRPRLLGSTRCLLGSTTCRTTSRFLILGLRGPAAVPALIAGARPISAWRGAAALPPTRLGAVPVPIVCPIGCLGGRWLRCAGRRRTIAILRLLRMGSRKAEGKRSHSSRG
jgi:hypothetical protein